jgi:hypothetical protein
VAAAGIEPAYAAYETAEIAKTSLPPWHSRRDSNPHSQIRSLVSSPLNDGSVLLSRWPMRELNPRLLGVDQARFRYTNRPWHRHEGSNLDLQLRKLASCPLDDGGKEVRWGGSDRYLDQESNLDPPLRRREHCPLCYRGMGWLFAPPAGFEPALAG